MLSSSLVCLLHHFFRVPVLLGGLVFSLAVHTISILLIGESLALPDTRLFSSLLYPPLWLPVVVVVLVLITEFLSVTQFGLMIRKLADGEGLNTRFSPLTLRWSAYGFCGALYGLGAAIYVHSQGMARSGGSFEVLVVALCSFLCVDKLAAWVHRLLASILRHEQTNGVSFYAGWRRSLLNILRRPSFIALAGAILFETLVFASIAKSPNPIYWKLLFAGLLLLALIRLPSVGSSQSNQDPHANPSDVLEVRDLDFSYEIGTEKRSVFVRASWRLTCGLHVLKGMNGAGKTTMLKLLAGFLHVLGGGIWFGTDRLDHRPPHRRPFFFMHQNPLQTLAPDLTAIENLAATFHPVTNPVRCIRPADIFTSLNARLSAQGVALFKPPEDPFWFKPVKNISFGEAYCISLYCAVLSGASVFLADEPTTGLDQDNFNRLTGLLRALASKHIIIVTSHDRRLNDLADQVFWIKDHKIELDDQH
jgi:ABC-type multidrug transport system ATPase subunit/ABC-type uncharacterized transport system permease subunit